jgi:hypothetical protein
MLLGSIQQRAPLKEHVCVENICPRDWTADAAHLVGKPSRMPSASVSAAAVTSGTFGFGGPCILARTSSGSVSGI